MNFFFFNFIGKTQTSLEILYKAYGWNHFRLGFRGR